MIGSFGLFTVSASRRLAALAPPPGSASSVCVRLSFKKKKIHYIYYLFPYFLLLASFKQRLEVFELYTTATVTVERVVSPLRSRPRSQPPFLSAIRSNRDCTFTVFANVSRRWREAVISDTGGKGQQLNNQAFSPLMRLELRKKLQ